MSITLRPIDDTNREAVLALSVREDQPFVAPNDVSLRQYAEAEAEEPGVARPFAIYADDTLVGFCMVIFDPDDEDSRACWLSTVPVPEGVSRVCDYFRVMTRE